MSPKALTLHWKKRIMKTATYLSPLGNLTVACHNGKLSQCRWTTENPSQTSEVCSDILMEKVFCQLDEYFTGRRTVFQLPIEAKGTVFQQKIWNIIAGIPYGTTISYSQLAASAGMPKASRAVAGACHANPIAIIIPCHRIIGSGGKLTGYAGGIDIKRSLLQLELYNP